MATPRLKEKYVNEVAPKLFKELECSNVNQVPRFEKIVVNMLVVLQATRSCSTVLLLTFVLSPVSSQWLRALRSQSLAFICVKVRQLDARLPFVVTACGSSLTV